jgi:hypothetical protein
MPTISSENQVTLPVEELRAAGLSPGMEVTVRVLGPGELLIAAHEQQPTEPRGRGYFDRLLENWMRR